MSDIPLERAMLVWEPLGVNWKDMGGRALVVPHPDRDGLGRDYMRSVGACFVGDRDPDARYGWPTLSSPERLARLLVFAWQATVRDGVSQAEMHRALCVIPEFRAEMTPDMPGCEEP
jgi:hypothetical protein